uniref:Uncharacterized protein n=1 Tax=Amphimedon queenslandica TaxID=400682 RepID=A0A1X7TW94_AMPQE
MLSDGEEVVRHLDQVKRAILILIGPEFGRVELEARATEQRSTLTEMEPRDAPENPSLPTGDKNPSVLEEELKTLLDTIMMGEPKQAIDYVLYDINVSYFSYDALISNLRDSITDTSLLRYLEAASESGASSWLTALPIKEHSFALHKGAFHDALCLRYGWTPLYLSSHCVCGSSMSIEHALNCKCGGFPSLRHNELQDITADLLTEICLDVQREPTLQPLSGETFPYASATTDNNAIADIAVSSFWSSRQRSYLNVRVFNPFSNSYKKSSIIACHRRNEKEKRCLYKERICNIEHGSFTPLIFTTTAERMGPSASTFL